MSEQFYGSESVSHDYGGVSNELGVNETFRSLMYYAEGLVLTNIDTDPATFQHELGVGQLAAQMLPPALRSHTFDIDGANESYAVVASVCGGTHDCGKYGPDVQEKLSYAGDFGHETRLWVRREHCFAGYMRLLGYQQDFVDSVKRPVLSTAALVALYHHSAVPEAYDHLPREQAIVWGLTHLVKYCDVLHALRFDVSSRRNYQKEREGQTVRTKPPEVILDIIHKECGTRPPIIDGVEIDIEQELHNALGL
ncbi:MAG TPA: HD domain-containing protein [Verrucomicrobiae bacterium]|nr:HD domain-containing protein [Verrucomicrobiae bacterium]